MSYNDFGVITSASKRKRRKPRYIKGYVAFLGIHKETRKLANRAARRKKTPVMTKQRNRITPDQGKQAVASNRCGNECGRRAAMADYLCMRCRE